MANIINSLWLKQAFGIEDENLQLLEFDKKHTLLAKNKSRFQSLDNYEKIGVNEETESPVYIGILKSNGEVATLDEYKDYQVKTANAELEKLEQKKQNLENKIAELMIENDRLTDDSWSIRDDYVRVAKEVDELEDLLEDLKNEIKLERRRLKRKIRNELQEKGFIEKLKFLIS